MIKMEGLEGGVLIPHSSTFFTKILHAIVTIFYPFPKYHFFLQNTYVKHD